MLRTPIAIRKQQRRTLTSHRTVAPLCICVVSRWRPPSAFTSTLPRSEYGRNRPPILWAEARATSRDRRRTSPSSTMPTIRVVCSVACVAPRLWCLLYLLAFPFVCAATDIPATPSSVPLHQLASPSASSASSTLPHLASSPHKPSTASASTLSATASAPRPVSTSSPSPAPAPVAPASASAPSGDIVRVGIVPGLEAVGGGGVGERKTGLRVVKPMPAITKPVLKVRLPPLACAHKPQITTNSNVRVYGANVASFALCAAFENRQTSFGLHCVQLSAGAGQARVRRKVPHALG